MTSYHLLEYDSDVFSSLHFRQSRSLSKTGLLTVTSSNTTGLLSYEENLVYFGSLFEIKGWRTTPVNGFIAGPVLRRQKMSSKRENKHMYYACFPLSFFFVLFILFLSHLLFCWDRASLCSPGRLALILWFSHLYLTITKVRYALPFKALFCSYQITSIQLQGSILMVLDHPSPRGALFKQIKISLSFQRRTIEFKLWQAVLHSFWKKISCFISNNLVIVPNLKTWES